MKAAVLGACAVAACVAVASAWQPRDNWTGTWVATDSAPPTLTRAPNPPFGDRFALRYSSESLTLRRIVRGVPVAISYSLDGKEVKGRTPGGLCLGDGQTVESATRDGDTIVLQGDLRPRLPDLLTARGVAKVTLG